MTVGGISTDNNQLRLKTADILIPRRCNRIFKNVMLSQASKIAYGKPLIDVTNYDAIKHHLTSLIVTSKRVIRRHQMRRRKGSLDVTKCDVEKGH